MLLSILLNKKEDVIFLQLVPSVGKSRCRFGPSPLGAVVLPHAVGLLVARHCYEPGSGVFTASHCSAGVAAVAGGGPLSLASCMMQRAGGQALPLSCPC
jgi:hypothetical protein